MGATPDYGLIDRRGLAPVLFYPRADASRPPTGATDLRIEVESGVSVGCRFWPLDADAPVILFFHGNGEVASDYDTLAPTYHAIGASLFVADYRGYGASDGSPSFAALIGDAHPVLHAFHARLDADGFHGARFVMGRSLGSLPATELAATASERLRGLILESGAPDLARFGERGDADPALRELIAGHTARITSIALPVLQIHGEWDEIIPLDRALAFHEKLTCEKQLEIIPQAGHNDIGWVGRDQYFGALARFLTAP